jgi:hypothetical protein
VRFRLGALSGSYLGLSAITAAWRFLFFVFANPEGSHGGDGNEDSPYS